MPIGVFWILHPWASAMVFFVSDFLLAVHHYPSPRPVSVSRDPLEAEAEWLFFFFFWHVCVRFKDRHGICKGVMGAHTTASLVVSISTLGNIVHHVGDFKSLSSY